MDKLPSNQCSQQELSANEFQEKLYCWLQEQGLISELRGHLRMQMVNAFQDNAVNASNSRQFSLSPKIQAISTLVADFLLQQGFCYSLSVYVTEVPIIGQVFSQFSQSAIKKTLECGYKFSARETEDILETLGVIPGSELFSQTLCLYQNKPEPLLLCIMRALSTVFNVNRKDPCQNMPSVRNECKSSHSYNCDINKCQNLPVRDGDKLRFSGKDKSCVKDERNKTIDEQNGKSCPLSCAEGYMKRIYDEELCKVREEEAAKYQRLLDEKLKEYEKRDMTNRHSGLKEWKERVEMEFSERERNLCQLASQLRTQHQELTEKLSFLEIESQGIKEKEKILLDERERDCKELELKKSEIEIQKTKLNEAYERLVADQEAVNKIQKELLEKDLSYSKKDEICSQQENSNDFFKKLTEQFNSLCHILTDKKNFSGFTYPYQSMPNFDSTVYVVKEDKGLQTFFQDNSSAHEEKKNTHDEGNELIARIEEEKRELNDRMMQQRQRIEELTIRAAELSNQLQDAQVALQLVRPNQLAVTTPPLTAPPSVRLFPRPQWPPHIGSGEETSFAAMNTIPTVANTTTNTTHTATTTNAPTVRQTGAVRRSDARRRPRRTVVHQNTLPIRLNISSEDSTATTDEMIEEARVRLRRLELESTNVQRNYEEFRSRQNGLESTASIVFHPDQIRATNPFDYRHSNVSSSFAGYPNINNLRPTNQSRSYASRLSHVSISRPMFNSFFSDYDDRRRNIRLSDFIRDDYIPKEFDERLENDDMVNEMETMREKIVAPIRTMSPTDLAVDGDNMQPLNRKVVQNTLKNHSIKKNDKRKNDKKKSSRPVDNDKNSETDLSSADSENNKDNDFKKKGNKSFLSSFDSTAVSNGNGSCGFNVNNEMPVFTALGSNFGSNKLKHSSTQKQFKAYSKNEFNVFPETEGVRISDIGSDTDMTDDEKICKINRKPGSDNDLFSSRGTSGKSLQQDTTYHKDKQENDSNSTENETINTHVISTPNKCRKSCPGPVVHFSADAVEEYHESESVEVILKQQSIKTWSSSTQPESNCNKQDKSVTEEAIVDKLESEKNVDNDVIKSQSLPAQPLKSFFSSGADEYTLRNFENGSVSKANLKDKSDVNEDAEPNKEQWFDAGSSDKIDLINTKNVKDGTNKENQVAINTFELPPLHLANAITISSEHINLNRLSSEHVFNGQLDHCIYPYPSSYRNLLRRVIRRDYEPSWLLKLKLISSNNCLLNSIYNKPDPNDFFFIPHRKSYVNLSMKDDGDDDDH